MKKQQRNCARYTDQHKDILNVAVSPWLEKRIKKVIKQGKKKRIAKYKNINPFEFRIEYPCVFSQKGGYFRSTVVARENGLCFPDPRIPFLSFAEYMTRIEPDAIVFPEDFVDIGDIDIFETLMINVDVFPDTPRYLLVPYTKQTGPGLALLILSTEYSVDFNNIYTRLFKQFTLQEISATWYEKGDENFPTKKQTNTEYYAIGTLTVKDNVFKDNAVSIDIFDVQHIKDIITYREFLYDGYYRYDGSKTYNGTRTY